MNGTMCTMYSFLSAYVVLNDAVGISTRNEETIGFCVFSGTQWWKKKKRKPRKQSFGSAETFCHNHNSSRKIVASDVQKLMPHNLIEIEADLIGLLHNSSTSSIFCRVLIRARVIF